MQVVLISLFRKAVKCQKKILTQYFTVSFWAHVNSDAQEINLNLYFVFIVFHKQSMRIVLIGIFYILVLPFDGN